MSRFKLKITGKHKYSDEFKWEMPDPAEEIHYEDAGFSKLLPGDLIESKSDGQQYMVDFKSYRNHGERVFVRLVSANPNDRGYDWIPDGSRYVRLTASIEV